MSLDWNDLKIAVAVSRVGSLTRAGRALGLDQTTVGRRLTALEIALDATLFVRTRAGVCVTEAGQRMIDLALEVEARIERLPEVVQERRASAAGTVRIEGEDWVLDQLVIAGLTDLRAQHPGLDVKLIGGIEIPSQWPGEPAVGVWFEQVGRGGAFAIKLGAVPFAPFAAADATGDLVDWAVLAREYMPGAQPTPRGPVRISANTLSALLSALACEPLLAYIPVCVGARDPRLKHRAAAG
ncbi:MAG: LysR family transcriptional regulator, partial [Pseudomonadota bacterium]